MPRRKIFSSEEYLSLLAFPTEQADLVQCYAFSENDLSVIRQHRGNHNRLGFAIQLCCLRYPGITLTPTDQPPADLIIFVASQLNVNPDDWNNYAERDQTRQEHLLEIQKRFKFQMFSTVWYRHFIKKLMNLALQTDKGIVLATALIQELRKKQVIIPSMDVIERLVSETIYQGTNRIYQILAGSFTEEQRLKLDSLLSLKPDTRISVLTWLKQPPGPPKTKHILKHIERLKYVMSFSIDDEIGRLIHQNRLLKIAREGGQITAQHLRDFETRHRYATLTAILIDVKATLIDEIVDLHDRIMGNLFNKAKNKHAEKFQKSGKAINEKIRLYYQIGQALLDAKINGTNPFEAVEAIIPWNDFTQSINEAQKLMQAENFDYLYLIGSGYTHIRKYAPALLDILQLKAAPSSRELLDAIEILRNMNSNNIRSVPENAPVGFVRKRWEKLVLTNDVIDRRFYELCILAELKNALRSGDIWIKGARQYKDFEEYLLPVNQFTELLDRKELPIAVVTDFDDYIKERFSLLEEILQTVDSLASQNQLQDVSITKSGLKISPLADDVPDEAKALTSRLYSFLPHLKITDLLLEVDNWTGFTSKFTNMKTGEAANDRALLLTAILSDAINLGLRKMAESCEGITYAKLSWLQAWFIRDDTYSAALAALVNAQIGQPLASYWGDGTASSSDGQYFRSGSHGKASGRFNAKHGDEPGIMFYTHVSDIYVPFYVQPLHPTMSESPFVIDGLLYHESELRIKEHFTDTRGFSDHVFALMHLLGFNFEPRIRDLADKKLYIPGNQKAYPILSPLIGGSIDKKLIRDNWNEILRLATSIKQGTVTASLMLRKLSGYPRQNKLSLALREFGRIDRTLFTLNWLKDLEMRKRGQIELNKGESEHYLDRAVFFNRLGEIRDRSFENQRFRASGLTTVVAAIILWNTVYLNRVLTELRDKDEIIDNDLLQHVSPLGWEHINLTGDYSWRQNKQVEKGKFRRLNYFENP